MWDDMSATSGTLPTSGVQWYSTPPIVSLLQMCTYAAFGVSRHDARSGMRVNSSASDDAATFALPYSPASLIDFLDHSPVWMKSATLLAPPIRFMGTIAFSPMAPPCRNRTS